MQTGVVHVMLDLGKRIQQRLDVFDGCDAHNGADVNPTVRLFGRHCAKLLDIHAVGRDATLRRVAPQLDLCLAGVAEQARHHACPVIDRTRQHEEETHPQTLERRQHPCGADNLLLALARVDAVLAEHNRRVVDIATQTRQNTAVTCGDGVVDVGFGHLLAHEEEHGQQHRAQRMEHVGERRVRVVPSADVGHEVEERLAHEKAHGRHALLTHRGKQHVPIRRGAVHEIGQRLLLLGGKAGTLAPRRAFERVVEEDLVYLHHVVGQLVDVFAAVGVVGPYAPQHKLMLGKRLDEAVGP